MKTLQRTCCVLILFLLLVPKSDGSGIPALISYQGRLTVDELPVTDTASVVFSVWDSEIGGSELWSEAYVTAIDGGVEIIDGLFSVILGSIEPLPDSLFEDANRWLQVRYESSEFPRTQLVSGAFTFKALSAEYAVRSDSAGYATSAKIADSALYADTAQFSRFADSTNYAVVADTAAVLLSNSSLHLLAADSSNIVVSDASWTTMAVLSVPPNAINSFVHIISKVRGSSVNHNYGGGGEAYSLIRIQIDGADIETCSPSLPPWSEGGGTAGSITQEYISFYFSPSANQISVGFTVSVEARRIVTRSGEGDTMPSAEHYHTHIWGL